MLVISLIVDPRTLSAKQCLKLEQWDRNNSVITLSRIASMGCQCASCLKQKRAQ